MKRGNSITCVFTCDSQTSLRECEKLAQEKCDLDEIIDDVAIARPLGVERRITTSHRLGDFFENVDVIADKDSIALRIIFNMRKNAPHFWKDIMARIVRSVAESISGVSVKSIAKSA